MTSGSSVVAVSVGKTSIAGLTVHAFSPALFIVLVSVVVIGVILWKYGSTIFSKKRKTECSSCMRIVSITNDTFRSKINAINDGILRQQLNYAELVFGSIELKIISAYKAGLDALGVGPSKQREEMIIYKCFIANETSTLKSFIRLRIKENHILEYSEDQFRTYVSEITDKIVNQTRLDMSDKWVSALSVPIESNKRRIDDLIPSIEHDVGTIFYTAYSIAKKCHDEILALEHEYSVALDDLVKRARQGTL